MRKKLIIALILYVIILSAGLGIVSTIAVNDAIERSLQKSFTSAQTIANQLDFLLQTNITRLYDISLSGKVNLDEKSWAPAERLLESTYQYSIFTEGVFLLDRHGNTLLSYPARDYNRENLLFIPWVTRVLTDGKPIISNVYTIEPIKKPLIFVLVPLRNSAGEIAGAAGGAIDPTNSGMSGLLRAVSLKTENHYLEIIDSNEVVVAADKSSRVLGHHNHEGDVGKMIKECQAGIQSCNHGFSRADGAGKTQDVLAIVPLQSASWAVVFGQTRDEVYLPARQLRNKFMLLALIFTGPAIIFSLGISKNIVSPIRSLIAATNRIARGDLSVPVGNIGRDEIAVLGKSFDGMREQLAISRESIRRQNSELEERVKKRTQQLEEKQLANTILLKKLITSQEDERKRIARDLHDGTLQELSAALMRIDMCRLHPDQVTTERIDTIRGIVMQTHDGLLKTMQNLRPSLIDDLGLIAAVQSLLNSNLGEKGILYFLNTADVKATRFRPEVEITLFRIIQEAVVNIARHSGAESVFVLIKCDMTTVYTEIEDNGIGFDLGTLYLHPADVRDRRGLGILGMQERAFLLGGEMDIFSQPGLGTRIAVRIPLNTPEVDYVS